MKRCQDRKLDIDADRSRSRVTRKKVKIFEAKTMSRISLVCS